VIKSLLSAVLSYYKLFVKSQKHLIISSLQKKIMYSVNLSQPLEPRNRHKIQGGQGVTLSVQEWGNPNGQTILFAHAYGMSHLDFLPQVTSDLLQDFRLITFDHRGHGESGKPEHPEAYNNRSLFAEDFYAIITTLNLNKPILVAHSMSGALMGDYLSKYGDGNVGAVVLLAANTKLGTPMFQTQIGSTFVDRKSQGIFSESFSDRIAAWNFVNRYLITAPPSSDVRDIFLASSIVTSQVLLGSILTRDENYLPMYQALQVPIMLVHAKDDEIVRFAAAEQLQAIKSDAKYVLYDRGAHAPHWENAEHFNRQLVDFAGAIASQKKGKKEEIDNL
jgi:non-heme chloroperoxidase